MNEHPDFRVFSDRGVVRSAVVTRHRTISAGLLATPVFRAHSIVALYFHAVLQLLLAGYFAARDRLVDLAKHCGGIAMDALVHAFGTTAERRMKGKAVNV